LAAIPPGFNNLLETASTLIGTDAGVSNNNSALLWTYFWQTVISNGVPAVFTIAVIGFLFAQFRASRKDGELERSNQSNNPLFSYLYDDLYGDQEQDFKSKDTMFGGSWFGPGGNRNRNQPMLPKNTGVPAQQYLKVTHLNQKYDSYKYTLTAATQSKAQAAAEYRSSALQRVLGKSILLSAASSSDAAIPKLQATEQTFLQTGLPILSEMRRLQTKLTQLALDEEMKEMGFLPNMYELDPDHANITTSSHSNMTTTQSSSSSSSSSSMSLISLPFGNKDSSKNIPKSSSSGSKSELLQTITKLQRELQTLELRFVQDVVQLVGPSQATSIRNAILGNAATSGSLLEDLSRRPLSKILMSASSDEDVNTKAEPMRPKKVFVCKFPGDVQASQVMNLREEVTGIVRAANPGDEAVVVISTGGGTVTGYGLATAQLLRLKQAGLKLTIAVEQVAASGGYMMCCVGDRIVASPFAVLGSIGVLTELPNVYERLKTEGIEFQTVTAGKYKRTLTPTKKVTKQDYDKTKQDIEDIFNLFRNFVKENRPQLDIDQVATGETWFGTDALQKGLCDEIRTVDDLLTEYVDSGHDVFQVEYRPPATESPLGKFLLPAGANNENSGGIVASGIRWLVRTVVTAVQTELSSTMQSESLNKPINERYMAVDDTDQRVRSQD
jgi:signal peptide peptidase SppA